MAGDLGAISLFSTVVERDVDLMILEQLHCSPDFCMWLTAKLWDGDAKFTSFEGACCSVSDLSDGESDLVYVAKLAGSGERVAFLIENKIKAPFQPRQQERYHRRGERGCSEGRWEKYRTAIIAPEKYLGACEQNLFHAALSYEALAGWFEARAKDDRHAAFKARLIGQATQQASKPWDRVINEAASQFFDAYWSHLTEHFPELHYRRPVDGVPAGSVWPHLNEHELPKGVALIHKTEQAYVDLQFSGRPLEWLKQVHPAPLPSGAYPAQSGRSSAIRIDTPRVLPRDGFTTQVVAVEAALSAASALIVWYRRHRDSLPDAPA